jgi:hypothetical protein
LLRSGRKWRKRGSAVQQCCKSELHDDPRFPAHKACAKQMACAKKRAPSSLGQNGIRFGEGAATVPDRTAVGRWKFGLRRQTAYSAQSTQPLRAHRCTHGYNMSFQPRYWKDHHHAEQSQRSFYRAREPHSFDADGRQRWSLRAVNRSDNGRALTLLTDPAEAEPTVMLLPAIYELIYAFC